MRRLPTFPRRARSSAVVGFFGPAALASAFAPLPAPALAGALDTPGLASVRDDLTPTDLPASRRSRSLPPISAGPGSSRSCRAAPARRGSASTPIPSRNPPPTSPSRGRRRRPSGSATPSSARTGCRRPPPPRLRTGWALVQRARLPELPPEGRARPPARFGWKAQQPSIRQQSADALAGDIGISSPEAPRNWGDCTPAESACLPCRPACSSGRATPRRRCR